MTQAQPKMPTTPENADGSNDDSPDTTPSWFAQTYGETTPRDMAEQYQEHRPLTSRVQPLIAENAAAYDAYRKRLEERFSTAQRLADPDHAPQDNRQHPDVTLFPQRPRYAHGTEPQLQHPTLQRKPSAIHPVTLSLLALGACLVGGGAGYFGANPEKASQLFKQGFALASAMWAKPSVSTGETVIAKKVVRTAKLEVKDASGAVNAPIALDIAAFPADAETPVALRISGLPPAAYLTKGVEVSKGEWMLKATDIAQAELVVPHTDSAEIALQVLAMEEKTGVPAAPSQDLLVALDMNAVPMPGVPQPKSVDAVIEPAAAVPDQGYNKQELPLAIPAPLESVNPEAQGLISKGERLLKAGDVLAARQFFSRAYDMQATMAAFGLGQTYDPRVYAEHNIKGLAPSAKMAAEWYGKAAAVGHVEAASALAELPALAQP